MAEKRYINAAALSQRVSDYQSVYHAEKDHKKEYKVLSYVLKMIEKFPTADVVEIKTSEWIENNGTFTCKKCGYCFEYEGYNHFFNYCPSCGALIERTEK